MNLEKVLEENCNKYEDNCNSCPFFQKECEEYSHISSKNLNLIRVLRELKALINMEFNPYSIIGILSELSEDGKSISIETDKRNSLGGCDYHAFCCTENPTRFVITCDKNNIITSIDILPR